MEMSPGPSVEICFRFFFFLWNERVTLGLQPLPVDCHVPHGNLATQKKNISKKQVGATTAASSFCVEASVFTKASRLLLWTRIGLLNRRSQYCLSPLQQLRKGSCGYISILYSSMLILLYSRHLGDGKTVENCLVCTQFLPWFIFRGFYFHGNRKSKKIVKITKTNTH